MIEITDDLIFHLIKQHYRPYDKHEAFLQGFSAYQSGEFINPHRAGSVSAQAWDLGLEAAMRCKRAAA